MTEPTPPDSPPPAEQPETASMSRDDGSQPRRRTPAANFNKAINLLILVIVGAVLIKLYLFPSEQVPDRTETSAPAAITEPEEIARLRYDNLNDPSRMNISGRFIPHFRESVLHEVLKAGQGDPAVCGQTVQYQLLSTATGEPEGEVHTLRMGDRAQPPAFTLGMNHMRVGEIRRLQIPPSLWDPTGRGLKQDGNITRIIRMVGKEPAIPAPGLRPRRFLEKPGSGAALRCGDAAALHLTFQNAQGETIFDSTDGLPIYLELGASQVPFGIEEAASGIEPGSSYLLLMPPGWQKPLTTPQPVSLPENSGVRALPPIDFPADQWMLVTMAYPTPTAPAATAPQPLLPTTTTAP